MQPNRDSDNLFYWLGGWWEAHKAARPHASAVVTARSGQGWRPTLSSAVLAVAFSTLVFTGLLWAQTAGAIPFLAQNAASTSTIAYQGRLADAAGQPLTGTFNMIFRLYSAGIGGTPLWTEQWTGSNSVQVSDGLFNVMLGSLTPVPQTILAANNSLFLGISVGTDSEMSPRVQLGSVPFAIQALTVPDGSISKAKLASDVSLVPPDGSITTAKLADGAVTQAKAPSLVNGYRNNATIQWGTTYVTATTTSDTVVVDLDFNPDFPSRPMLILQPHFAYTTRVVASWGLPCDATTCRVWITRTDGGTYASGQAQGLDWVAIGN